MAFIVPLVENIFMDELIVSHLSKIYNEGKDNQVIALDQVSFSLEEGSFNVILGASGAGKSTLLNLLGGMDMSTKGSYTLHGQAISNTQKDLARLRRNEIGFVFQFYNLLPNLTAYENVALAASVAEDPLDPEEVLKEVGLEGRIHNFPSQLSGGEQQRVAIARALVKNPRLLLCDEPTGALDSKTGVSILKLLFDTSVQRKKTVVVVTHNASIAQCATHLLRMKDGKIIEDSKNAHPVPPEEIAW